MDTNKLLRMKQQVDDAETKVYQTRLAVVIDLKEQVRVLHKSTLELTEIIRAYNRIQDLPVLCQELIDVQKVEVRLEKWKKNYREITRE